MVYTFWNNKGGTGKTSLCFQTITEYAIDNTQQKILVIDLCPQANLSELLLGGMVNTGGEKLITLWNENTGRRSIGGYFQDHLPSPYSMPPNIDPSKYISHPRTYNLNIPNNIDCIAGDRIVELQSNSISALSITQIPPMDTYVLVVSWLKDLLDLLREEYDVIFIDTNPSFAIYTQIALTATDRLLIPVMADDSSKRALKNVLTLVYGLELPSNIYNNYSFNHKLSAAGIPLPKIHLIIKNRITQYMGPASAYSSVLNSIDSDIQNILNQHPEIFTFTNIEDGIAQVRDFQTTGVVAFAEATPFSTLRVGSHRISVGNNSASPRRITIRQDYLHNYVESMRSIIDKID